MHSIFNESDSNTTTIFHYDSSLGLRFFALALGPQFGAGFSWYLTSFIFRDSGLAFGCSVKSASKLTQEMSTCQRNDKPRRCSQNMLSRGSRRRGFYRILFNPASHDIPYHGRGRIRL